MKKATILTTLGLLGLSLLASEGARTAIEPMPEALETRYALSALPPALRDQATVYLLDTKKGYRVSKTGSSGVSCLVERTAWEQADFRDDIFVPLCYDAPGTRTYLKVIMDVAAMRIEGLSPQALKTEVERRYHSKVYQAPQGAGLSYMIAPIMRTWMMPDMKVHTMPMPHLMFYAPKMANEDIGARPDVSVMYPFVFKEGLAEQTYLIQLLGEAEKAALIREQKSLLDDLCGFRDVLCMPAHQH